jgi:hypothetical protein
VDPTFGFVRTSAISRFPPRIHVQARDYCLETRRVVTAAAQCGNIKIQNWWIIVPDLYFLHGTTGMKNY